MGARLAVPDEFAFFFGADSEILEERYAAAFGARLAVIDVPRGTDIRRYLASFSDNGLVTQQSAMSLMHPERLIFAYERVMALAVAVAPKPRSALLLGLGGGTMTRFLSAYFPDCALTIIEHDPAVLALARRHFRVNHPVETFAYRLSHDGRSLTYSGDTGESDALVRLAEETDLLLCEASFEGGRDEVPDLHLTGGQAGAHAKRAGARRLVVTHVPPWTDAERTLDDARRAYPGPASLARPGATFTV